VDLLDRFPVQWDDARLQELHIALATSIYRESDIEPLVVRAGVPPADVPWGNTGRRLWFVAMNEAAGRGILRVLVEQAVARYPQLGPRVAELLSARPVLSAPLPEDDPLRLNWEDARWHNFSPDNRERQIVEGQDTMLDIAFLRRGMECAGAVCRLTTTFAGRIYHGTGFRVGVRTLLTNHHVLHDWKHADSHPSSVEAAFGYELDVNGRLRTATLVPCDVATIRGEREHDFAVIMTDEALPDDATTLPLDPTAKITVDSRVYIVQHPGGLPKKIALAHNLVRYVTPDVVQYWTDTEAGSSGSPVFDDSWRVVALHHQWVEAPDGDGLAYRNQGRAIGKVIERMAALGIESNL
jgi:V8-like Glu-specific endopeptidase